MFARSAEKLGVPSYQPPPSILRLGKIFAATGDGPSAYAAILVAEEVLDIFQRDLMKDERVQPLIRAGSQIHVVEEARHMRFAREEIARRAPKMSFWQRRKHRTVVASVAAIIADNLGAAAGVRQRGSRSPGGQGRGPVERALRGEAP